MKTFKKKKILLVAPYGGVPGGISRWTSHIVDFYSGLDNPEVQIDLMSTSRKKFINIGMSTIYRIWHGIKDYREILKNYNTKLRQKSYDLVHLTSSGSLGLYKDLYILSKAKKSGAKCVVHFHFGRIPELFRKNNHEWKMILKVCRICDCIIVLDKDSYNTLKQVGFSNVKILPNPVAPRIEDIVNEVPKIVIPNTILFVGHVVPTKGVFELIEAFSALDDNLKLKLVGHITPDMRRILSAKLSPEVSKRVEICGEKPYDEVIKDMLSCDIFVLPTYTEGFPNVILEAMATGCAIVTTPVGAIPQILEHGDNDQEYGVFIEPKKAKQLRDAIVSLIYDDEYKEAMRNRVQKRVVERYNISSVWEQLVRIWNSI